jgi:hypothetical protein
MRGARLLVSDKRSTAVSGISPLACRTDRLAAEGDALVAAALAATGVDDAKVQAAWVVGGYTWLLAEPALTLFMREGRVLDLRPDRVTVAVGADGAHEAHFEEPSPPAPDRDVARARLVAALEQNLAAVLALPRLAVVGARLRWTLAADMLAGAALHLGFPILGREATIREAEALCAVPGRLRLPLDLIPDGEPDHHPERWRSSCCLAHRVGHDLCPTCPRRRPRA